MPGGCDMPSRDVAGKRLSGAAQRRRKHDRIEQARRAWWAEQKRLGLVSVDFGSLPPPPLGDSLRAIPWFFDLVAVCGYWAACDPFLTLQERARLLSRFAAVAGMLRDAAIENARLVRLRDGCSPPPWR